MPTKNISRESVKIPIDAVVRRRRKMASKLAESDERALREGNAEEMVRELVRETISMFERYLDE